MTLSDWHKKYVALREKAVTAAYKNDTVLLDKLNKDFNTLPTFCSCEGCLKNAEDSRGK
jgi:hypothetical protein